jgi:phosphoribosylamine--glycine ligase
VTIVLASAGYPASSHKGDVIEGLDAAAAMDDVTVYHAGTAFAAATSGRGCFGRGDVVTAGGRVLAVSALGDGFAKARERAYQAVARIRFDGLQSRPDIAERAVRAAAGEITLFPTT